MCVGGEGVIHIHGKSMPQTYVRSAMSSSLIPRRLFPTSRKFARLLSGVEHAWYKREGIEDSCVQGFNHIWKSL